MNVLVENSIWNLFEEEILSYILCVGEFSLSDFCFDCVNYWCLFFFGEEVWDRGGY